MVVNQADQVQLVGHCRQVTPDGLPSQKESTVVHDHNCAIEATRRTMNLQRNSKQCLNCLSHLRGQEQVQRFETEDRFGVYGVEARDSATSRSSLRLRLPIHFA